MSKHRFPIMTAILVMLLVVACAGPPRIALPPDDTNGDFAADCAAVFPQGNWQFAHAIQAHLPDGSRQTMIGITRISAAAQAFECAMLTLEGMVLFQARYDGTAIEVKKAVPPMDQPGFAQGLIDDIALLFFPPAAPPAQSGLLKDGARICRYPLGDGIQDVVVQPDGRWEIRRYGADGRPRRTVLPDGSEARHPQGFPSRLELRAHGAKGYRLNMSLMEAVPLDSRSTQ
ncbi:DUF3261 domain-containing protein [Desulfatitalea alkaliphila]|uniref:DUF3261 domain-containing protein n=1 Tax=Desulfatitalea alkaliphila TaxID=2929485 RepID=A0AA41R4Y8_9BACT|nr:DUF3261 domain-containing protein [Desulfatitalea alkaliphila]MCJ8501603.1 DUF3261 domain-containing protein [Desulfatitalea alkaliphila]